MSGGLSQGFDNHSVTTESLCLCVSGAEGGQEMIVVNGIIGFLNNIT